MGYIYDCNVCDDRFEERPPAFMGEFRETFLKSTPAGGRLAEKFNVGETLTVCPGCSEEIFL